LSVEGEPARWSVRRPRISDYSSGKDQCAVRRASSGPRSAVASESAPLVPSRLRNFLRGEVCQRESARSQSQLLGIVDRLQILEEGDRVGETLCRSRCLSTPPP